MKKSIIFIFCLLFMGQVSGQDSTTVPDLPDPFLFQIDSFSHYTKLNDHAQILFDPYDEYQLADFSDPKVLQLFQPMRELGDEFFPAEKKPWCKISLQNNLASPVRWNLSFNYDIDSVVAYIIDENKKVSFYKVGQLVPHKEIQNGSDRLRNLYDRYKPIYFELKKGERKDIFFRSYSLSSDWVFIIPSLRSNEQAHRSTALMNENFVKVFFYTGMLSMIVLYNFLIFIFYKEKAYLFLALYSLCFILPEFHPSLVYLYRNWFPDFPFILKFRLIILNPLVFITISLFMRSFLKSRDAFPRTDKYLRTMMVIGGIYFIASVLYYIFTQNLLSDNFVYGVSIIGAIIFVLIFFDLYKSKDTKVRFWLAAMSFLLILHIIPILIRLIGFPESAQAFSYFFLPLTPTSTGVLGQIAIFTLGLGYTSREVAKEKKELEELDQLKSRFFANISHEFRTPLTLMMGPIKEVMENQKNEKDKNLLKVAHQNAERLLQLINQLLDLSKLESGKMELKASQLNFSALLKGIVMSFESLASRKNIRLHFVAQNEETLLYVDQDKMEKIFYNLLSNAFKFTEENGEVSVMLSEQDGHVEILIRDTGIGIPTERLPFVFDRFYQVDDSTIREKDGTGIGLTLVKELVKLHSGEIHVESDLGKGTTFKIKLLKGKAHLNDSNISVGKEIILNKNKFLTNAAAEVPASTDQIFKENNIPATNQLDLPVILIIEDNHDVRAYIKQHLTDNYKIMEAINGQEGIDLALEHLPDLIISDVMMPKKDGYEVCHTLKTDQRSSHIPIILLTAKAAQEEKIHGLETGADDYLIKPFDSRELQVRVGNLIELRKKLRLQFSEQSLYKAAAIQTNSVDQSFMKKICDILEAHISDGQFGVETFAKEAGMSRVHLNRKLNALTDQSANKFIQSFRLQRAYELLQQKSGNVSEIAFETGFSSTAYFVKCFRERYGKTPGTLLEE